ncbi:SLC35A4 upstream open reading frame protein-like isoform X1 [Oncorhynchus masou masou]|uniref:SLC35A4 upstream open reading frame protein-like isoform X1 n=1 Tax=Oncorhynchus masou masou TaxID=90313 RepID=UPI0031830B56
MAVMEQMEWHQTPGNHVFETIPDSAPAITTIKDPLRPLKDLAELKDQLEDIQRRVEKEVQAGIPQGGSVLASPFLKGFLAGYIVSRLRSSAVLGVILGTCTGIFAAQNFGVPNIEQTLKDCFNTLKGPGK